MTSQRVESTWIRTGGYGRFRNESLLDPRKNSHRVKTDNCKYCDACFTTSSSCNVHEEVHTGVKDSSCRNYSERFNPPLSCKRRKRIHAGVAVQEERHSEVSSMESPMAEHGKKKPVNIFSSCICQEELGKYDLLLKDYDNRIMLSDTTDI